MSNYTKIAFFGASSISFGLNMLRDIFCSDEMRGSTHRSGRTQSGDPVENDRACHAAQPQNRRRRDRGTNHRPARRARRRGLRRQRHGDRPQPAMAARLRSAAQIRHPSYAWRKWRSGRVVLHAAHAAARFRSGARDGRALPAGAVHQFRQSGKPHHPRLGQIQLRSGRSACAMASSWGKAMSRVSWELPSEQVEVSGAGINHFQCLLQIRNRSTGEDLYPLLRKKEKDYDSSFAPLTRQLFRAFGLLDDLQRRASRRISGLRLGGR